LLPPEGKTPEIAPSLNGRKRGIGTDSSTESAAGDAKLPFPYGTETENDNPTVVPRSMLEKFQFTFLIRDPHSSIPSWYRCTVPPLVDVTGFYDFYPNEAGYDEERRFFDYLRNEGMIGPKVATGTQEDAALVPVDSAHSDGSADSNPSETSGDSTSAEICVIDADDLLDDPEGILRAYCKSVGLEFTTDMLNWDNEEDQARAQNAFEKWKGFHDDALGSKDLKPRAHVREHPLS
jgi:hypothetical protein